MSELQRCINCIHAVPFRGDTLPGRCSVHGITLCVGSKASHCHWHDARNTSCERWEIKQESEREE
jgi:hypothetical protein